MKCEFCGANIDIEAEKCPFCGMNKSQFEAHREDMRKFKSAYKDVEQGVLEKNRKTTEKTVRVTIVTVLCLMNLIMLVLIGLSGDIAEGINKRNINANHTYYLNKLNEYEENGDYISFYCFYNYNKLYKVRREDWCNEYTLMFDMANNYYYLISTLNDITYYNLNASDYGQVTTKIEIFADSYEEMQKRYNRYIIGDEDSYTYDESCFSEMHMESYEQMMENLKGCVITYLKIDESRFEEFENASKARKIIMIEEGLGIDQ